MRAHRVRARYTKRFYGALAAAGLTALAAAPAASATNVFGGTVKSATAKKRTCDARLAPGARGVSIRRITAADTGLLRVKLGAPRGDWDVAVFDAATKKRVAASAGFKSREVAESGVRDGQRLVIQACRRSGRSKRATIQASTIALKADTHKIKLVRVHATNHAQRTRLANSGLDITEHGGAKFLDVLAHGNKDLKRIRDMKFGYDVILEDVVAADAATLRSGRRSKRSSPGDGTPLETTRAPVMPSGRVAYRHLADYQNDMKALVDDFGPNGKVDPGYVRPITLNHPSLEGRLIQGLEIASNVGADDGRPVFLQMGIHHAREWPSGEHAIEFAFDLINNRKSESLQFVGRNVNVRSLLDSVRTIVVPIVNPDGFNLSREAAVDAQQGVIPASLAYKRKNCRVTDGLLPAAGECASKPSNIGVDPNRNYGGFWGGAGASPVLTNETYWGAAPFSEPETQSIRELVSQRQVVGLITNHTYSDLVLRPPGLREQGEAFDEHKGYKALGDGMAEENGYTSEPSYGLYDTTGTTEDWSYYATGGFGFTFEIGKGEGVALTGAGFHPVYPVGVVAEYFGKGPWAARGNRSAYFKALEWAAKGENHSVIKGTGKPDHTLTLTKSFETLSSQPGVSIQDELKTTMKVDGGEFVWHVNPSTRPNVAKGKAGRVVDPSKAVSATRDFAHNGIPFAPGAKTDVGLGTGTVDVPGTYEEVKFSIPENEDNGQTVLRIEYPVGEGSTDLDLYVHRVNEDGSLDQIGSSTSDNSAKVPCSLPGHTGDCSYEEATVSDLGNGDFVFRVHNWASTSIDWVGRMTFNAPVAKPGVDPATEAWTLTCYSPENAVVAQRQVYVERGGQPADVGNACKKPRKNEK